MAWLSYLDGSATPQSSGWLVDATDTGTVVSLGGGNSGIRQSDTGDGYDEWYIVNTNQASTLAARFLVDSLSGGPVNLLQLTAANSAADPSPALAIGIRDGRFYLLRFVADNAGAPAEEARLADLGPVQNGIFNEAYIYIDNVTKRVRLFWNNALRYSGVETNAAHLFGAGEGFAEFGASNYYPESDRSAVITVTYDWVGFGTAADLPLALPFIAWTEHLDGSSQPMAPWQLFQDTSGTGAGTTENVEFVDPFNGATNYALRLNSGSGANEWYVGAFFEDEVFAGARFAVQDFSPLGKENLMCVTTRSLPMAPSPAITLVDGRYKLWNYVIADAELLDIGPVVTNEFHTAYLYAHYNGRVRFWWDGALIFDDVIPLVNPYDGYFEWGSGSWQFDATDTVDFDWVAFGVLTSAPQLTTTPANGAAFQDPGAGFSFSLASESGVGSDGVAIEVNGADRTGALTIGGTDNLRTGSLGGFVANQIYGVTLVFTELDGDKSTNTVVFDTFSQSNFMFEAEDWNFDGGQYIDNPVLATMTGPNSYFGQIGVEDIDQNELSTDFGASQHEYRDFVFVGTEATGDMLRQNYLDAQTNNPAIRDYNVGWVENGEWLNYTRTFPAGTYNIYGRFANGNIGQVFEAALDKVQDPMTVTQTATPVGVFRGGPGRGWQSYDFVPLTDSQGAVLAVELSGVETLRVTSVSGGYNANFYMLVRVAPPLQISQANGSVTVSWQGSGYTLETATSIGGSWTPVATLNNSYTVTHNDAARFFRLSD